MATTTHVENHTVAQARPVAAARAAIRLNYLDTLRALLIVLVIALHTAITYGAIGDWTFVDPNQNEITSILLTFVTTTVQAFSLGLYFFVSGYFTPGSYDRKGTLRFWKDRFVRLAVPMLIYTFALSRVPNYVAGVANGHVTVSFWSYFTQTFITDANEGPTWFIFALLMFLIGYTLWRLGSSYVHARNLEWTGHLAVPGKVQILAFGLLVSLLMFIIGLKSPINNTVDVFGIFSLMVIFFAQYILFFIAGILAYRNDWMVRFNGKDLRFWGWFSVGLFLMMPVLFFVGGAASGAVDVFTGGLYWQSAAFMLWIGLFSVSFSMTLILWLRDQNKNPSPVIASAGPNSYAVYLIHPLILVPVSVMAVSVPLPPLLKFIIVLPVVVVLCFLVAAALRRIPGVKAVL